jgi:hypothetical protein
MSRLSDDYASLQESNKQSSDLKNQKCLGRIIITNKTLGL